MKPIKLTTSHNKKIADYYRLHAQIYDMTRWSFLFGREKLLTRLPDLPPDPRILEIGCGTGKNIELVEYLYPDAIIYGIDLSEAMLDKARDRTNKTNKITLLNGSYRSNHKDLEPFDLILLSYSLTMIGKSIEQILEDIFNDLKSKGHIAVVDFHNTPFKWFRRWMGYNHVTMNGQVLPLLNKYFTPVSSSVNNAYMGLWSYFLFIGHPG